MAVISPSSLKGHSKSSISKLRKISNLRILGLALFIILIAFTLSSDTSQPSVSIGKGAVAVVQSQCLAKAPVTSIFATDETIGTNSNCSYSLNNLPAFSISLKEKVQLAVRAWGYEKKVRTLAKKLEGKRLLDVGMGQGPWGAALIDQGLQYYVGLDPDVCPPVHARTRDPTFPRKGSELQCMKAYNVTDSNDPKVQECTGGEKKYRPFDVTGLEMMAAHPGKLALLPGTFETLHAQLKTIHFDAILLKTVTEHLSELNAVFAGLWELMSHCSAGATVIIDHHNYYSFSGHHGYPTNAQEAAKASPELLELADWGHVHPDASQAKKFTLNHVRPGDLQAVLDIYFDCSCEAQEVAEAERNRLKPERKAHLEKLGFDVTNELFTNHMYFECQRRSKLRQQNRVDQMVLHHPPLDGSYKPQRMTCKKK
jgi:hypothetical protein